MAKATEIDIETRAKAGRENFLKGYNCAQSVIAAFADIYPSDDIDTLLRLSASFGGGMGRLRMTCGAASGMFMLAGLENGSATPGVHAHARWNVPAASTPTIWQTRMTDFFR